MDGPEGEWSEGRIWVRKRGWREWWRSLGGKRGDDDEVVVSERTRLLG